MTDRSQEMCSRRAMSMLWTRKVFHKVTLPPHLTKRQVTDPLRHAQVGSLDLSVARSSGYRMVKDGTGELGAFGRWIPRFTGKFCVPEPGSLAASVAMAPPDLCEH